MSKFESKIREALMEDENETIREMAEEQGVFAMMLDNFRGRNRWLMYLNVVAMIVIFAVGVYSIPKFLNSTDTGEVAFYGMLLVFSMMGVMMIKLMAWMEINKNSITREILRVELRVVEISKKLDQLEK